MSVRSRSTRHPIAAIVVVATLVCLYAMVYPQHDPWIVVPGRHIALVAFFAVVGAMLGLPLAIWAPRNALWLGCFIAAGGVLHLAEPRPRAEFLHVPSGFILASAVAGIAWLAEPRTGAVLGPLRKVSRSAVGGLTAPLTAMLNGFVSSVGAGFDVLLSVAGRVVNLGWAAAPQPRRMRYLIIEDEPVRRGGMAEVRKAFDTKLKREVALKQLHGAADDSKAAQRFAREGGIGARLNHPNIVVIFDTDVMDGRSVISMEFLDYTLGDLLRERGGHLAQVDICRYGHDLFRAIAYSHEQNVVHRDVGLNNVMFGANGQLKLCDFGAARELDRVGVTELDGWAPATPQWASQEQREGKPVSFTTDVYSAALLLAHALTGQPPDELRQTGALARAAATADRSLIAVLRPCLVKEPSKRPTAEAVATRLEALARRSRSTTAPTKVARRAPTTRSRSPKRAHS